jgi:hypothetical protein
VPLLSRKRLILAKTEQTYGTDSSPGGTDAILVRDLSITPLQSDVVDRELIRPYLGASEQLLANTRVEVTFQVELAGSGAAGTAPAYGRVIQACGFSQTIVAPAAGPPAVTGSVTYSPVSDTFSSVTIYYNIDGVLHKVTGCRGTFALNGSVGEIPTISFTMTGIYNSPTDTAAPSVTYSNQATPQVFKNGTTNNFQLLSYSGCLQSVELDMGNEVIYRELVGCNKEVLITNRAVSGTVTIEAPTIAQKDYFTAALGDVLGNLTFQHGQTAGNIVTVTSTTVDIGDVSYEDQDGIHMLSIPVTAVPGSAGNDEIEIVFT